MASAMRSLRNAALAAAAMYWLDPTSGRRRRARLRDQALSSARGFGNALEVAGRDLSHRLQGFWAQSRSALSGQSVEDAVLTERVRSCLGRAVSHPGAIEVAAEQGHVTLTGAVLQSEHEQLMHAVHTVKGAQSVEDRLAVYSKPDGISSLQGGRPRRPRRFELLQENWSPAARLLTGVTGSMLFMRGLRMHSPLSLLGIGAGGALLARSVMNMPLKRLAGATGRRTIDIHKTIHVNAPVEQVFETLSHYENFPAFMRNVRYVSVHDDGRSHWMVAGPGGMSVEWDAVTTQRVENEVLAWRTVPNSTVDHAGIIKFFPDGNGTRLELQMSYSPPAGALGHVVARLFGADPKTELDQDMMRLKSFLETGKPPRDAAAARIRAAWPSEGGASPESERPIH